MDTFVDSTRFSLPREMVFCFFDCSGVVESDRRLLAIEVMASGMLGVARLDSSA